MAVAWAVSKDGRKKSRQRKYHIFKSFVDPSFNVYYRPLCQLENDEAVERDKTIWKWSSPSEDRRCHNCQQLAEAVEEVL